MRFKYYLRGAGIGVIVATLVLSIAFLFHDNISDEEVIRRAMKLGMVMQENTPGTLADMQQGDASSADLETGADPEDNTRTDADPLAESSAEDPNTEDSNANQSQTDDPKDQADPNDNTGDHDLPDKNESAKDPSSEKTPDNKPDNSKKNPSKDNPSDKKDEPKTPSDEVEIVIESGDVSRMVSAKVFEAGLVEDADEFNSYLGSHDYDNQLQPGTYKIKKGSSFRQIAQILTRQ